MERNAGILMPVFSLPSKYGIGAFDKSAYNFVDFLKKAGQRYWQILPLGPTGYADSPYQSFSTFAGNPYFISLENFIFRDKIHSFDFGKEDEYINYGKMYENRICALRELYKKFDARNEKFITFKEENKIWLDDYALFMALKNYFNDKQWLEWEDGIKKRERESVLYYTEFLKEEIEFHKFLQYLFYKQWNELKVYANKKNIKIIGDIPIYVALDSVDVWANPELFQLDENYLPKAVAGCPPDGFSEKGQLWGNPLYNWKKNKEDKYLWWCRRLNHSFVMYDVVRIDHFRGFCEYYSIPYGNKDAVGGHWETGPGKELFAEFSKTSKKREIIAEDLGFLTEAVKQLLKECGFPGMKVLEFAFDKRDTNSKNDYLPHNYPVKCVAYTGTHDNQTLKSWFKTISLEEQRLVREYLCDFYTPDDELNMPMISLLMRSSAQTCIIPIQDYLSLDDKSRINTPATQQNNWRWRIKEEVLSDQLAEKIKKITKMCGR